MRIDRRGHRSWNRIRLRMAQLFLIAALAFVVVPCANAFQSTSAASAMEIPARKSTVGFPTEYREIVLPAPEVVARQMKDRSQPVVVRIDHVYKHGSDFRYDLQVTGLEPGEFNVGDWMETTDGQPHPGLPRMMLKVDSLLPAGQVEPHPVVFVKTGRSGYYLPLMVAGGVLWLTGLLAILFARRFRTYRPGSTRPSLTLADRIRPMLVRASLGNLDSATAAELERTLTSFWRRRLRLEHLSPEMLMASLRKHDEAGPLLNQLESWLHRPDAAATPDLDQLLRPYRSFADQGL